MFTIRRPIGIEVDSILGELGAVWLERDVRVEDRVTVTVSQNKTGERE